MKKYLYIFCTLTGAALMGCTDLDLIPEDTMAPENYFSSEEELRQYTNAYYGMLPGADDLNDICADDVIKNILDNEILGNRYPSTEKAWDWDDLRVINYYFENSGACKDQNARRHYDGFFILYACLLLFHESTTLRRCALLRRSNRIER